jgi:predicted DNA-binding protein
VTSSIPPDGRLTSDQPTTQRGATAAMTAQNPKAMTLRLPPDQASALEAVAQVNGVTVAEEVRKAIQARIDALRADPDFQARLRDHLERNREILNGLAST